jgi:hypothetical protein
VVRPASFDVVGYTMMSCADLRGAFDRLIRYPVRGDRTRQ